MKDILTRNRNRYSHEDGFTLIEMMVVVAIIGVLVAISTPHFLKQREVADTGKMTAELLGLSMTVGQSYYKDRSVAMEPSQFPDARISDGTTWDIANNARGYCLSLWDENDTSNRLKWESTDGTCDLHGVPGKLIG